MHIAFFNTSREEKEVIKTALAEHKLLFFDDKKIEEVLSDIKNVEILSVFVDTTLHENVIGELHQLKMIAARSTGYDHIAIKTAQERGIIVSNVPIYGARTVAEFTFALILALSRKAFAAYDRLRETGETDVKDFEGFDISGKTIGIIGTGNIGKNVARIAQGFDMQIIACDIHPDEAFAKETRTTYREMNQLVEQADIISLHVPYTAKTHHLINEELLKKCKRGSYIINTSRGDVIDTQKLVSFLHDGHIGGAALDVVEGERDLKDELSLLLSGENDIEKFRDIIVAHELIDMPNVIVTPHIAFNTVEAKKEIMATTIANIQAFNRGVHKNVVNGDV